jgi:hypothetical protein
MSLLLEHHQQQIGEDAGKKEPSYATSGNVS